MTRDELPWPAKELAEAMWGIDTNHRDGGRDFVQEHYAAVEQFLRQHPTTFHEAYETLLKIPEGNRLQSGFIPDLAGAMHALCHADMDVPADARRCVIFRMALKHWSLDIRDEAQSSLSWLDDFDAIPLIYEAAEAEKSQFISKEMKKTAISLKRRRVKFEKELDEANI
jgi:hypothetical protein